MTTSVLTPDQGALLRLLTERSDVGIAILDGEGRHGRWANTAYLALLAGPSIEGKPLSEILPRTDEEPLAERVREVARTRQAWRGEALVLEDTSGGRRWWDCTIQPLPDAAEGSDLAVVLVDATERVRAQAEMRECIEDYVGSLSHDLRNPLMAIRLHVRVIEHALPEGSPRKKLDALLHNTRRIERLIDDLVDEAAMQGGHLRLERTAVDVGALLTELLPQIVTERDLPRFVVEVAEDTPAAWADPQRLERILTNLVTRAPKYAPAGSRITIRARPSGAMVEVEVASQGEALDEEEARRIFERPDRSEDGRRSPSLGLYVTRRLVEAHGGRIRVESAPGRGSTFRFELPRA